MVQLPEDASDRGLAHRDAMVPQAELKSPRPDAIRGTVEAFEYKRHASRRRDPRRSALWVAPGAPVIGLSGRLRHFSVAVFHVLASESVSLTATSYQGISRDSPSFPSEGDHRTSPLLRRPHFVYHLPGRYEEVKLRCW